jgi:hypothetical protein
MATLLTRQQFREQVFARDKNKCVVCGKPAVDAHHIMERKLWPDGGYYLENGASVCEDHHWDCELDQITPDDLREIISLPTLLPPGLAPHGHYDKWGNQRS